METKKASIRIENISKDTRELLIGWCFKKYDTTLNVPIIDIKES